MHVAEQALTQELPAVVTLPTSAQSQHFKVGEAVKVGDTWEVTVNSVKTNNGSEYLKPKDGKTYLVVNVTTKNLTNQEQNMSSILNFSLKDTTGQKADIAIIPNVDVAPNGKVEAGGLLRGNLAYEVPKSEKKFTLSFQNNLLSGGQTLWDLSI